jgi:glycosyltransferase involved in cell wall biosynthesis
MTIGFVLKGYPRLSETFIAQEIHGLEQRGCNLRIVSLRRPSGGAVHPVHRVIGAPVHYLPEYLHRAPARVAAAWPRAMRLPGFAAARGAFLADLRRDPTPNRIRRFGQACVLAAELPADVRHLHAHFLHAPASVARYAALMRELPFSASAHAKDVWITPAWDLATKLRGAAWVTACNAAAAEKLRNLCPDAPVDLLYHGLDLRRFAPPAGLRPSRTGLDPTDPLRILTVARAVEKKGLETLLEALAMLPGAICWRLVHIGAGGGLAKLQQQARRLGIAGRIEWRGAEPQDVVLRALRAADLFVLPSRVARNGDRDGLPNVLMEAQSQRLAVVATHVAGIPELVRHGETGMLVPPGDALALTRALERLARNPEVRAQLGTMGEARLRAGFDSDAWLDRLATRFKPARTAWAA